MEQIKYKIKLVLNGGEANPGLKQVGPALGGKIGNIMDFCKQFNAKTKKGRLYRVIVLAYGNKEKSFSLVFKGSPTSFLIMEKAAITSGSSRPNSEKKGEITKKDILQISEEQIKYSNAFTLDGMEKMIAGTAKRMGVKIID